MKAARFCDHVLASGVVAAFDLQHDQLLMKGAAELHRSGRYQSRLLNGTFHYRFHRYVSYVADL